jgi:hypothetical protein
MHRGGSFAGRLRVSRDGQDISAVPQRSGDLWRDGRELLGWRRRQTVSQSAQGCC